MNDIAEMLIILLFSHISDDVFDSLFALVYVLVKKEVYLKIFLNSYNNVIFMDQRFSTSYGESLQDPVLLRLEAIYTVLFFDSKHSISIIVESMTNRKEVCFDVLNIDKNCRFCAHSSPPMSANVVRSISPRDWLYLLLLLELEFIVDQ